MHDYDTDRLSGSFSGGGGGVSGGMSGGASRMRGGSGISGVSGGFGSDDWSMGGGAGLERLRDRLQRRQKLIETYHALEESVESVGHRSGQNLAASSVSGGGGGLFGDGEHSAAVGHASAEGVWDLPPPPAMVPGESVFRCQFAVRKYSPLHRPTAPLLVRPRPSNPLFPPPQ